jgi:hypothetical protein
MLFLLNAAGVPSVGTFVQISSSAQPPDFSLSASPATQTVIASGSAVYTIKVNPIAGFTGTVSMSVSGLPAGSAASFNPQAVSGAGSSTLTVNTGVLTPAGNYSLIITGASAGASHTATVNLTVIGVPLPPVIGH